MTVKMALYQMYIPIDIKCIQINSTIRLVLKDYYLPHGYLLIWFGLNLLNLVQFYLVWFEPGLPAFLSYPWEGSWSLQYL